jgi:hypothetical protein
LERIVKEWTGILRNVKDLGVRVRNEHDGYASGVIKVLEKQMVKTQEKTRAVGEDASIS